MTQSRCFVPEDLGGGKFRHTIGLRPVQYNRGAGWLPITGLLGASGDPVMTLGANEAAEFYIRPRLAGDSPVMHFGRGTTHVRLTPLGTANVNGVVSGNKIAYPGAWANTGGLIYELGGHILRKRVPLLIGHPTTFAFRVDSHAGLNYDTLETADFRILPPCLTRGSETVPLEWIKTVQGGKLILTVNLPSGNWAGWELDPTLTLQPDAAAGKDTLIIQAKPLRNFGIYATLHLGNPASDIRRSLIQFDWSSIPAGALISSTVLTMTIFGVSASNNRAFDVYKLLRAWVEGTKDGAEPADGATWNTYDGTNNWGTAGCANTTTDREANSIGTSATWLTTDTLGTSRDTSIAGTSKAAIDNGYGWLLQMQTEVGDNYYYCSSDYTVVIARRPKVVVDYTAGNPYYAYAQQ